MAVALLDVNVLLALAWPNHVHHMAAHGAHRFWPLGGGLAEVREEIRARVVGHHQANDAVLLDLAIGHQGRLATFDRRILGLLPADSRLREAVAVIPVQAGRGGGGRPGWEGGAAMVN